MEKDPHFYCDMIFDVSYQHWVLLMNNDLMIYSNLANLLTWKTTHVTILIVLFAITVWGLHYILFKLTIEDKRQFLKLTLITSIYVHNVHVFQWDKNIIEYFLSCFPSCYPIDHCRNFWNFPWSNKDSFTLGNWTGLHVLFVLLYHQEIQKGLGLKTLA